MAAPAKDILEYFREEARNNRDLGDKFERVSDVREFLNCV
jgi:hypothetical protein